MISSGLAPRKSWELNEDYIDGVMRELGKLGLITNESEKHQIYTLKHQQAFIAVQSQLYGSLTYTAFKHDTDKLVTYGLMTKQEASGLHRKYALHHVPNWRTFADMVDGITDFECARFTKPDKPLNAYDTIIKYYPERYIQTRPALKELGIDGHNTSNYKIYEDKLYDIYLRRLQDTTYNVIAGMAGMLKQGFPIEQIVELFYSLS